MYTWSVWKLQERLWNECAAEQVCYVRKHLWDTHHCTEWAPSLHTLYNYTVYFMPKILLAVFLDAVVLTGLMLLMNTYPTWLYPCLFYLRVSWFHGPLMRYLLFSLSYHAFRSFHTSHNTFHSHLRNSALMWVAFRHIYSLWVTFMIHSDNQREKSSLYSNIM